MIHLPSQTDIPVCERTDEVLLVVNLFAAYYRYIMYWYYMYHVYYLTCLTINMKHSTVALTEPSTSLVRDLTLYYFNFLGDQYHSGVALSIHA